jgi:hypothetical protein
MKNQKVKSDRRRRWRDVVSKTQNLKVRFNINIGEKMREKSIEEREGGREGWGDREGERGKGIK